jgi:hypothetical protein
MLPVWVADPAMLTNPLEIIWALRPLLQRVDMGLDKRLDEAATVDAIARTQLYCLFWPPSSAPTLTWWWWSIAVRRCTSGSA